MVARFVSLDAVPTFTIFPCPSSIIIVLFSAQVQWFEAVLLAFKVDLSEVRYEGLPRFLLLRIMVEGASYRRASHHGETGPVGLGVESAAVLARRQDHQDSAYLVKFEPASRHNYLRRSC